MGKFQPKNEFFKYKGMSVRLKWDRTLGSKIDKNLKKAQIHMDTEVMRYMDDYIPKDQGVLLGTVRRGTKAGTGIVSGGTTPYARRLYYSKNYHFKGAPMRGSKWFERMKKSHKKEIIKTVKAVMGRDFK